MTSRLIELVRDGEVLAQTRLSFEALEGYQRRKAVWHTSAIHCLVQAFGQSSTYYHLFTEHFRTHAIEGCLGVLESALRDYRAGYLFDTHRAIEVEVFEDLIEQSSSLLRTGGACYIAAAVLAGAVLEDGLRRLCIRHAVELPDDPKLNWMNDHLVSKAYDAPTHKKVGWMTALRNDAAHGKWVGLEGREKHNIVTEVEKMIPEVRSFLEYHYLS